MADFELEQEEAQVADHPEPEHVPEETPVDHTDADEVKVTSEEATVVSVAGFPDVEVGPKGALVSRKHAEALALSVPSVEVAD
jgi:hypothetical protein